MAQVREELAPSEMDDDQTSPTGDGDQTNVGHSSTTRDPIHRERRRKQVVLI